MNNNISQTRSFSIALYLGVVFALSWPFQIAAVWANDLLSLYTLTSISMVMVTVGTVICGQFIFQDGFIGAGWQWGNAKLYLVVIGFCFFLWGVPSLIELGIGRSMAGFTTNKQFLWIFVILFVNLIPAFGEEFGWRGYMLPRMAHRFAARRAVIFHAIVWWAWHLPIMIGTAAKGNAGIVGITSTVLLGAIPATLHGVIFAYIWSSSSSLAVTTVYHAAYDGIRDSLQMILSLSPMAYLLVNLVIIILGVVLLLKGKWSNLVKSSVS